MEVNPFKFKYETIKYKLEIINKIIAKNENFTEDLGCSY